MKTIALVAQKGGCGKSALSVLISQALREQGTSVLLIDLDTQGNSSRNCKAKQTVYDVLTGKVSIDAAITEDTIKSDIRLAEWELKRGGVGILQQRLQGLKSKYDICVLDCPPALGTVSLNAIHAADVILTPVTPGMYSLEALPPLMETIASVNPEVDWYIVCNMWNMRRSLDSTLHQFIREGVCAEALLTTIIPQAVGIGESLATGEPLKRSSKAGKAIQDLLKELSI